MKSSKWADFFVIGSAKNKREVLFPQTDDTTTAVYFRVCESLNSRECCCTSLPHCPKSLCSLTTSLLGSLPLICVSEAIIQEGRNGGRLESAPRLVGGSGRMRQRPSHLTPLLPVVPSVTILPFNKCHKQRFTPSPLCSPSLPPTAFIAKLNGLKALSIRLVPITALYALSRDGRQKWHTCMRVGGPHPLPPLTLV